MKRYAVLVIALGIVLGAGARWATSPWRPAPEGTPTEEWFH